MLEQSIFAERVRLLYGNGKVSVLGNAIASSVFVFLMWSHQPQRTLLAWLSAVLLIGGIRLLTFQAYSAKGETHASPKFWGYTYALTLSLTSCTWGFASIAFFSTGAEVLAIFIVILAGVVAASMAAYAIFLPAYVFHVVPTVLPFTLRLFAEDARLAQGIGMLSLLFLAINIYYARNVNRNLIDLVRLRFEREQLANELQRQKWIAEQASLAKTRFLAAASHDLRQPAQALGFFTDALARELKTPRQAALVENIRAAGLSLQTLLDSLLDFARVEAAAVDLAWRDFPVDDLLRRLAEDLRQQAEEKGLRLAPSSLWVHSDPLQLERILRNLIFNAIKYTEEGGVLIGCRREAGRLRIEVHDTGVGIPPELQKDVFREFYQLGNPERDRNKGLGLGLAIVHGLAELMGHPLALRSTPGRGSVFSVAVPLGMPVPRSPPAARPLADELIGRAVLVIDDDPMVRESAAAILESFGCVVVVAESAGEAIGLMRDSGFRPEAMLVDYRLREGASGVEAIRSIRAFCGQDVPAAVITGDTAPDRVKEMQASGFALGHKPLSGAKLRALLTSIFAPPARRTDEFESI